ncbi:sodium- and chloride-dependent taurine transporter-like [Ixodes scapularis]|uniref:sodium- and chloride-dependent taurine transporter-like n=1 Tax=Ixodes scapularis TaxID=6945 RepID=UPI001C38C525|nr:sodium- and chloride-dependent taurine transporter-like [Ixodes scapularis]
MAFCLPMTTDYVWELSDGASSIGSFKKELFGFLTILWLALFLLCSRPQTYVREVHKLVSLFAVMAFLPFLFECSFNHLSLQALSYSFLPDIKKLAEKQVWMDAAEHTLLSLGSCCGIVILMGSRCKYGTSMERLKSRNLFGPKDRFFKNATLLLDAFLTLCVTRFVQSSTV